MDLIQEQDNVNPYNEKTKMWGQLQGYEWQQTNVELEYIGRSESALKCPRCGSDYLHHYKIELFACPEDSEVDHLTVACGQTISDASFDNNGSRNPSARRHGLIIHFDCEECGGNLELNLAQHKGHSQINWNMCTKNKK
jgi:hypothetical protein